jgi:hypothetical protein
MGMTGIDGLAAASVLVRVVSHEDAASVAELSEQLAY